MLELSGDTKMMPHTARCGMCAHIVYPQKLSESIEMTEADNTLLDRTTRPVCFVDRLRHVEEKRAYMMFLHDVPGVHLDMRENIWLLDFPESFPQTEASPLYFGPHLLAQKCFF